MDFPSNSHNVNQPKPKDKEKKVKPPVEKVVTGEVVHKKKTLSTRFKDVFFKGEFKGAARYITTEVLIPALKNLAVDATSKGIERVVYGESNPRRRYNSAPGAPRFSYQTPVDRGRSSAMLPHQPPYSAPRRRQALGEIILSSRGEADTVVERLTDIIDRYEVASVADLYDLLGLPTTYTDNSWGWTNLSYVNVRQTRDGYVIDLPDAEPL